MFPLKREMSHETMAMTMFSSLINEIQDTTVSGLTKRQLRALTRITDLFVIADDETGFKGSAERVAKLQQAQLAN